MNTTLQQQPSPTKSLNIFFLLVLAFFFSKTLTAQTINFSNEVPMEISVCQTSETFTVGFTNETGGTLSSIIINVQMPSGIEYVPGSLTNVNGGTVNESNISVLNNVSFNSGSLADGASISFDIEAEAGFAAFTAAQASTVFRNTVNVSYPGGSASDETDPYNVLYPALSITSVDPLSTTVFVGGTYTRTVTIVNGGFGATSSVLLTDTYDSNLSWDSANKGTLNAAGTELTLSSADFITIGDGDVLFEQNESITITQTITATGCNSAQSDLQAFWGCDGQTSSSNHKFPYTTIQLFAPNLAATPTSVFNTCVDGSADVQSISLKNNGSGPANQTQVRIFHEPETVYTKIDPTSIRYSIDGGASTSISAGATTDDWAHTCLGNDGIGSFTISLPTIQPNETVVVEWDSYTCEEGVCPAMDLIGWEYNVTYTDMCFKENYTRKGVGQEEKEKGFSVFYESPSDLVDGQTGEYVFIMSSAVFNLPEGTNPYFEVVFDIPTGLIWSGNNSDLTYISGQTSWAPSSVNYDTGTKKLTAQYPFPIPITLPRSEFRLNLTLDCSIPGAGGVATVGMQLFYIMDSSCPSPYRLPLTCHETPMTFLHCPGPCEHGLVFQDFEIERTTFGQPDNNQDGSADASGSLDFNKIKLNRVMESDQFKTTFTGKIKTSATYPNFGYGYASSNMPYGNYIDILSAEITITDKSTGDVLTCNNVPFTDQMVGSARRVDFDFSPATLVAQGCNNFSGYVFEDEDEIELVAHYEVIGNIGGNVEQVMVTNDFYVSPTENGTAFQCNDWSGNFTLIGYYFTQARQENYQVKTCTKVIQHNFYMSIGNCCTNYAGGDFFPYEFRNWGHVKNLRVVMPDNYTYIAANVDYYRTRYVNSTILEQAALTPSSINGQTVQFDMASYFTENGGSLNMGDDGFHGTVYVEVAPNCDAVAEVFQSMNWYYTFQEADVLGSDVTAEYSTSPDRLKFRKGNPVISTTLQTVDGTSTTVSWEVTVKNSSAGNAPNTWLFPVASNGALEVVSVERVSDVEMMTSTNGFYQLNNFTANQSVKYRITATYNSCAASELMVYTGYSCDGYPTNFSNLTCAYNEFPLYVNPLPSELQIRTTAIFNFNDPCSNVIGVEVEMLSSKLAAVKDIEIDVNIPANQSITMLGGSVEWLYPTSGAYESATTPTLAGNTYTIKINDIESIINENGLVGITDVTSNSAFLKFDLLLGADFKPGDDIQLDFNSKRACNDPLPTLSVAFDPNAVFAAKENIGLESTGDNWAGSWGDYDSDGYPDLFVVTYDLEEPNELFHNNGDGTFTKITTGAIATDLAPSVASSWADYDNDGDVDLYVGNNIGYPNFLYRNEGGGNFTRIQNDPIVNSTGYSHGVAWADYDNDGYVDMFVATYWETEFNHLYHNNGDGTFTKVTNNPIVNEAAKSLSGVWGDYDNDGWIDLFVANMHDMPNSLYKNLGNGNFHKVVSGDIVTSVGSSTGASWGDYNNDGYLDIFVANASDEDNHLYRNNRNGTFTKVTTGPVVNSGGHSHGSAWADFDNDGDLDLFIANDGHNNWLYRNDGYDVFVKVDNDITKDGGLSFGSAWADIERDGDVDLFVANREGTGNFIYENGKGSCQSWTCMNLTGILSNKSAVGAKVYVYANIYGENVMQMREITTQSGGGTGGQNDMTINVGLGDANIIDSIVVRWPSGFSQTMVNQAINSCISIVEESASEVCGIAYYDANGNCEQDAGEIGIANAKIVLTPNNITVYTDEDGRYTAYVQPGIYGIRQELGSNWEVTCPNGSGTHAVNVTGIGEQYCGYDFGNNALCESPDLKTEIAITAHRIGEENLMVLNYENSGATASTATEIGIYLPASIELIESTVPFTSYENNIARWMMGELKPGAKGAIYLKYMVGEPATIGEMLTIESKIDATEDDCDASNDNFSIQSEAMAAFDPNDILVSPEGFVSKETYLEYKIRFQNVGNSTASLVRVEDVLPAQLDLSTFEMGITSHTYKLETDGRKMIWTFPSINLPDSLSNEAGSHGFIIFRIQPKADLAEGDKISNQAAIYFDNLEPVITNVVENIINSNNGETSANYHNPLLVTPNPTSGDVTFQSLEMNLEQNAHFIQVQVFDFFFKPMTEAMDTSNKRVNMSLADLPSGSYIIRAIDNLNRVHMGKVVLQKN